MSEDDRTPKGGFVHRIMPPTDWFCGEIPDSCYDKDKYPDQIRKELMESYLSKENVGRLMEWLK